MGDAPSMGRMMMAGIDFAYVGRAKCGCVRSIIVDDAHVSRANRVSLAQWMHGVIMDGQTVERLTMADSKEALMAGRHCPHVGRQLGLIEEATVG